MYLAGTVLGVVLGVLIPALAVDQHRGILDV
jgi:hypothetical protein